MPAHPPIVGGFTSLPDVDNKHDFNKLLDLDQPETAPAAYPQRKAAEHWRDFPGESERPRFAHIPEVNWVKLYLLRKKVGDGLVGWP
jgi:hypothetical protein